MAAKIINAKSTVTAVSGVITTVYTVPSDKAARVRIMFAMVNDGSTTAMCLFMGNSGTNACNAKIGLGANIDLWTGVRANSDSDTPGTTTEVSYYPGDVALHYKSLGGSTNQQNNGQNFLLAPLPIDYYLIAGDTVRFGTTDSTSALTGCQFYVMGVEDDA